MTEGYDDVSVGYIPEPEYLFGGGWRSVQCVVQIC